MANTKITTNVIADGAITSAKLDTNITISGNITGTLATAAQPNITSVGTLSALTVDDITINGSTISDAGDLTLDVAGDIILDADGEDILLKDGGVEFGLISGNATDFTIMSRAADRDLIFRGKDGGSSITALTLDMSAAGAATFNDLINIGGSSLNFTKVDGVGINAKESLSITIDSDNNDSSRVFSVLDGNGTTLMQVTDAGEATFNQGAVFNEAGVDSDFRVESNSNTHMLFVDGGNDRVGIGAAPTARTFEVNGGTANTAARFTSTDSRSALEFVDSSGTASIGNLGDHLTFLPAGVQLMELNNEGGLILTPTAGGHTVFNEGSVNADFRVESDSSTHMLFVDGGNNTVNVGTSGGTQTTAILHTRKNGANIEFGHGNNTAGYFGTVGAFGNNGKPYIGFSTACENGVNTFSTFGSAGNIIHGDLAGSLVFSTVGSASATGQTPVERWYMGNTGHFTPAQQHAYDIGGTNAEVRNIYAQGISFASNANASGMTSELLDDYEEGTFTIAFENSGTNPTVNTVSNTTAYYTKIGNTVRFMFYSGSINFGDIGTGSAKLTGLPFTSVSGTYSYSPVTFAHTTAFDSGPTGYTVTNSNYIQCTDALPATAGCQYVTGTKFIMVSGVYQTA